MIDYPWHAESWRMLSARQQSDRLPHALLLVGDAGLGKRGFADRLTRALLCAERGATGDACGHCRACQLLHAGTHPDRIAITLEPNLEGKLRSEIVVGQIRALSQRLAMASQFGGWQVALIDPADAMNPAAANALLKTLEEPSARSMLVLVADAAWRLPATIRSRCQRIVFRAPAQARTLAWLTQHGVDDAAAADALQASGGNPGVALALVRSQALPRRAQVLADVAALRAGRADAWQVAQRWVADEPDQRLRFAARDLHRHAASAAQATPAALERVGDEFARFNRAREWLRSSLRPELVLLDALARLLPGG